MATAVLDLDVDQLPSEITALEAYSQALILIRFHGCPVGQAMVPVTGGRVSGADLRALIDAPGWPLWERWLHELLEWDKVRLKNFPLPSASVALCTRDRPDDVRRCLGALTRLHDDGQEILVIDNSPSTEATRQIVESHPTVRYVREPRPGLNIARNRALREARHDIVAFTDDDAAPDRNWLRALLQNFSDPLVLCVTGLTMPLELETDAQEWHERYSPFGRGFRRRVFDGTYCNPMSVGEVGSGVNMALRRNLWHQLGPFDEALDSGTRTRSGGDSEMFSRILSSGYRIVYEPQALNWHRHRRTWRELRRMVYGYGVGVYAAWTRSFLVEHELGMLRPAVSWFFGKQLPALVSSILRQPCSITFDLVFAELRGCAAGPWSYLAARRELQKGKDDHVR
jgi:glycosyltransferase involved in cell wall biosynthesis